MMTHSQHVQAIQSLIPDAKFLLVNDALTWLDERPQPSLEELEIKASELAALDASLKTWPSMQQFMEEFSLEEMAAISLSVVPKIAALRLKLFTWRDPVRSNAADVILGLDAIQAAGILTPERRAQILSV